jgi:hypothetical protein
LILDNRPKSEAPHSEINLVQDGYFAAVGTKLLTGRDLSESDMLLARCCCRNVKIWRSGSLQAQAPLGIT